MSALYGNETSRVPSAEEQLSPEDTSFLLLILNDVLMSGLLETWINGIYGIILGLTIYALVKKHGWSVWKRPLVALMPLLYFFATLHMALRWASLRLRLIVGHGNSDFEMYMFTLPKWMNAIGTLGIILGILIADGIMVWRCWVICRRQWAAIVLPSLLTIAGFVMATWAMYISLNSESLSDPTTSKVYGQSMIIQNSLNLATSMVTTLTIVVRIATLAQGNISRYRTVLETLVETAALYSIAVIFNIIFIMLPNVTNYYPQVILVQLTGLAPTLILARVTLGYTHPTSTVRRYNDSTVIQFNQGPKKPQAIPTSLGPFSNGTAVATLGSGSKYDSVVEAPRNGVLISTQRSTFS